MSKGNRGGSNPTRIYGNLVHQEREEEIAEWLKQEEVCLHNREVREDHCAILGDDSALCDDDPDDLYYNDDRFYDLPWLPAPSPFD